MLFLISCPTESPKENNENESNNPPPIITPPVPSNNTLIATLEQVAKNAIPNTEASLTHQSMVFSSFTSFGVEGNNYTIAIKGDGSTGCKLKSDVTFDLTITCGIPSQGGSSTKQNLVDGIDSSIVFTATGGSADALDDDVLLSKTNLSGGMKGVSTTSQQVYFTPTAASKSGVIYTITINGTDYTHTTTGTDSIPTIIAALNPKATAATGITCSKKVTFISCSSDTTGTAGKFTYSSHTSEYNP